MKNATRFLGLLLFMLAGFFVFTNAVAAADIVISQNTTWNKGDVIISNANISLGETGIKVNAGATLTINAGTIVKMAPGNSLVVAGNLIIKGNANDLVTITSIKDDSVGGDSNGDGSITLPAQGDWRSLRVMDVANATIDYADIKYGGASSYMVEIYSKSKYGYPPEMWPKTIISNSLISQSANYGIFDNGNKTVITENKIFKNRSYGIRFQPRGGNEITYNNFYDNGVITQTSYFGGGIYMTINGFIKIANNNFYNNPLAFVNASGVIVNLANNWWGLVNGPILCENYCRKIDEREIIVGKAVYEPFLTFSWVPEPPKPDPVILVPGILGSWEVKNQLGMMEWKLDPIFHVYDNLMEAMISAGYKEHLIYGKDRDLFVFPYDWRVDNNVTAGLLKQKIEEVKEITGRDKVDIVAHSMGGLVTRAYVEGNDYQNDIDQVIFLGTPHLGSLESYIGYDGGEFTGDSGWLFKYAFQIEAISHGYINLLNYIHEKVPTVQQLLPIYDYLQDKQVDNNWQYRVYPTNYPINPFLENLNTPENLNLLKQRVNITNIVSNLGNFSTLNIINVVPDPDLDDNKWLHGYPENLTSSQGGLIFGSGDGTVPYKSANSLTAVDSIETVGKVHKDLPTTMQEEVVETLTGHRPESYFNNKLTSTIKRWLFIRVYSPVDFVVTAPDGKRIGKDFMGNGDINEIDDAFYSGFGNEAEFALIPNPTEGDYKIKVQGVDGGGEYTLAQSYIDDDKPIESQELQVKSQILDGSVDEFTIDFSGSASTMESEIDFNKLIELTNLLYEQKEIKKDEARKIIVDKLKHLRDKYDKIKDSKSEPEKKIKKLMAKLELRMVDKLLQFYQMKGWVTVKAVGILTVNINLLVDKL